MNRFHLSAVLGLFLGASSGIASAEPAQVFRYASQGLLASAGFGIDDPDGCISTDVAVIAGEDDGGWVFISRYDHCNFAQLLFAEGHVDLTPEGVFSVDQQLASAHLDASASLYDSVSGSFIPVELHLTWTATGRVSRQLGQIRDIRPGFTSSFRWHDEGRPAVATGSISIPAAGGGTENLAAGASLPFYTQLGSSRYVDMEVTRGQ